MTNETFPGPFSEPRIDFKLTRFGIGTRDRRVILLDSSPSRLIPPEDLTNPLHHALRDGIAGEILAVSDREGVTLTTSTPDRVAVVSWHQLLDASRQDDRELAARYRQIYDRAVHLLLFGR